MAETLDDREAGNLGRPPDREGGRAVGRDGAGDTLHGQDAALAILFGKNQTHRADGIAGGVVGEDGMDRMAVEVVALKPVGAVARVLEPVVDGVDLETNAETLVTIFGGIGNR